VGGHANFTEVQGQQMMGKIRLFLAALTLLGSGAATATTIDFNLFYEDSESQILELAGY
jgi:hypothetical protein